MAEWQRTLNLTPNFEECEKDDPEQVRALAKHVAAKLRALTPFGTPEAPNFLDAHRDSIAEEFEALAEDEGADADDFDNVLGRLYDWGDAPVGPAGQSFFNQKKACWIKTF
ncbi:hypothetical protein WK13_34975 [Burkholderia ubonensis]|uniref:hypothetical protein n=1 Tax=Burkholderia ubonensis TaxID=101571 RepID=UPI00075F05B6|nr:hypothetical protein [Burkholderia ubonensis]KVR21744.1 hypothetical protein WK13_34975 [Burkholderia ubonensis]